MNNKIKKCVFPITIIIWILLDLLSKNLASIYMQDKINIIWDFLYFKFILNSWIAFSIKLPLFVLKIITISLIIWIFYYYIKEEQKKNSTLIDLSFWLILAGAIWNWVGRILKENVIDFIAIKYFSIFNLADSFIFIWVILYLYIFLKNQKFKKSKNLI